MDSPELAIRMNRARFNRALAEADLAAIAPLLAPGALLVTGTDSAVLNGRKAQLEPVLFRWIRRDRVGKPAG